MARPSFDWERIRAEYEAGATQGELSRKFGASRKAIQNHIAAENWSQDYEPVIQRLAGEKVAGVVAGSDPQKKAAALDLAAQRRADVEIRHCTEWEEHQALIDHALARRDFELAKLAKITAETIKIRQEGERKAWRIDSTPAPSSQQVSVTLSNVQNVASPEEIKRLLAEEKAGNELA